MVTYEELLARINALKEDKYAEFQRGIIPDEILKIAGVRMPALRKLAAEYKGQYALFASFPDEYFEVVFIKLCLAARLPYEEFIKVSDSCVALFSDWALCDCFAPACIAKNKERYIPFIKKYLAASGGIYGGGYVRRFAFTTLLHFYVEEEYLPLIFDCINSVVKDEYYVVMGAAWLLAEVLVKYYEAGFEFLNSTMCDINIRFKAISKACDSFRISEERKNQLKRLRAALRESMRGQYD